MLSAPQLRHAAALLDAILAMRQAADKQMDAYFRTHKNLGVRDRGAVAETVYGCLRRLRLLRHVAGDNATGEALVACYSLLQGLSARALESSGIKADVRALSTKLRTLDPTSLPFAVQADLPDWLAERLQAQYPDALTLAQALNRPAPVDLRVNTLKTDRETLQARLRDEGFDTEPTPYSPVGLRRHDRAPLFRTQSFRDGWFEIQDEGSQLIALLLEPKRRERIVDFCAGGGGKTLQIGALLANTGTVYAFDVAQKRLDKLKERIKRAGLDNVRAEVIAHERDTRVKRLHGKMERVLVDAPCSGTGTLRRNPDIKWREQDLEALVSAQKRILAGASELVKPGGRLVYATCSLLREENEAVVEDFLAAHTGFSLVPARDILARRHVTIPGITDYLQLLPHTHGTDGFFAAAFDRLNTSG